MVIIEFPLLGICFSIKKPIKVSKKIKVLKRKRPKIVIDIKRRFIPMKIKYEI